MKRFHQRLLVIGIFSLVGIVAMRGTGAEENGDPFAGVTPKPEVPRPPPEPDHLAPVNPYPGDWHLPYTTLLRSKLKMDAPYFARMVMMPSFAGESVVRLHGSEKDREISETEKIFLTYSHAEQNLWYSMPENNEEKVQKDVKITTTTVSFPKADAMRLLSLWNRMILRTRVRAEETHLLDGTTFEFATQRGYGETSSPRERHSPLLFVELGGSLIDYCKSEPEKRKAQLKEIESKADELERYLNVHQP